MVSYDSVLCDLCGDEVYGEFFGEPSSSPRELEGAEQAHTSVAVSSSAAVLNEVTVDSLLLAALAALQRLSPLAQQTRFSGCLL